MCLCVETIRIVDGCLPSPEILTLHQERMIRTCRELFCLSAGPDLAAVLAAYPVPVDLRSGVVKCRMVYGPQGIEKVEYFKYSLPVVGSLLVVTDDGIEYSYKFCDRSSLAAWHDKAVAAGYGDALIVRRGVVTDTTFCNVAFRLTGSKPEVWHTPAGPLLRGTMRQRLIKQGIVVPCDIPFENLRNGRYDRIALFNAMNDFGTLVLPVAAIGHL